MDVDIDSLQDFRRALGERLAQATAISRLIDGEVAVKEPAIGEFVDASLMVRDTRTKSTTYSQRLGQLRQALTVAMRATDQILAAYRTTEDLNRANAASIEKQLTGVGTGGAGAV